jgi:hypothetical protein
MPDISIIKNVGWRLNPVLVKMGKVYKMYVQ